MTVEFLYRGAIACQAAGMDKQRFNEAVAAKKYPCAPKVPKGGTRTFAEDDIIALFIYARLTEQNYPPRVAGEIACDVRKQLEMSKSLDEVRIPRRTEKGNDPSTGGTAPDGGHEILIHMTFDVAGIREAIGPALKRFREGH